MILVNPVFSTQNSTVKLLSCALKLDFCRLADVDSSARSEQPAVQHLLADPISPAGSVQVHMDRYASHPAAGESGAHGCGTDILSARDWPHLFWQRCLAVLSRVSKEVLLVYTWYKVR